ncbi:hypothetical protein PC118_g16448 [Phytophthora cactorum]|uniref:Uncharacterized protein n=1 Tax=Phytophthora cactorum TaxID=29920 RepID=A0A8T1FMI9_9STRA|nr:hypothetical protein PC118_g16448 [Phytophthora cactorum]
MVLSLAMAEQLASATGTGYQIGTSLVSKPQQSKLRKANRPRKPLSNPNRVRNELRFELAYLRETVSQLEQELSSLQLDTEENMLCDGRARQEGDAVTKEGNAERENARLRLIVERQGKVAIDLSELLRKRMAECAHASDPYAVREGNQEPRPALYSPGGLYEGDVVLYSKSDNAVEGRPSE